MPASFHRWLLVLACAVLLPIPVHADKIVLGLNGEYMLTLTKEWEAFKQNGAICKARVGDNSNIGFLQCFQVQSTSLVFSISVMCENPMARMRELGITAKDKNVDVLYLKCVSR